VRVRDLNRLAELLGANPIGGDLGELLVGLEDTGALLKGHFALQSGHHSEYFLRLRDFSVRPQLARVAAERLLELAPQPMAPNIICPESAGYLLGRAYFDVLGGESAGAALVVAAVNFERRPLPVIRRGKLRKDIPSVIVNDVATTGRSIAPLVQLAGSVGSEVAAVVHIAVKDLAALRQSIPRDAKLAWLFTQSWPTYPPSDTDCPGCKEGVPLVPAIELN